MINNLTVCNHSVLYRERSLAVISERYQSVFEWREWHCWYKRFAPPFCRSLFYIRVIRYRLSNLASCQFLPASCRATPLQP